MGRCWLQCQLVGGGPTRLRLSPSPFSLLRRKRQMESEGSILVPTPLLPSCLLFPTPACGQPARGTCKPCPASALHRRKGQLLTARGRPASRSPTNTLLPPSGCEHPLHICFEVLCELRRFFLQTKHALSRSLSNACFEITKTPGVM